MYKIPPQRILKDDHYNTISSVLPRKFFIGKPHVLTQCTVPTCTCGGGGNI
jgi:hypothetical protein